MQNQHFKREDRIALGSMALGKTKADIVFKNAKIVDVFSQTIIEEDVAIAKDKIIGIGQFDGRVVVDAKGKYLIPGLIDSHIHIESTMVSPGELSKHLIKHGTTCLIADPHEIGNVKGLTGIEYMMNASQNLPLRIYYMLPSCVPATDLEKGGAVLRAEDLTKLINHPMTLGLGEMMNYPGVFSCDKNVLDKLDLFENSTIDGHGPQLKKELLNAYILQGVKTDHECTTPEEVKNRISRGMTVSLREGSAAKDLAALLPALTDQNWHHTCFCTDDRHPEDLLNEGHIDHILRKAVYLGVPSIRAVTMATYNSAKTYGLKHLGAIAPGYYADLILVEDLIDFKIASVYFKGKLAYDGKQLKVDSPIVSPAPILNTVNLWHTSVEDFKLPLSSDIARVIRVEPESLLTKKVKRRVVIDDRGNFKRHPSLDIVKLAVLDRYSGKRQIGLGLVENYGINGGAIAVSISHDSHHLIVVGDNDEDMHLATCEIVNMQGGIALVKAGKTLSQLALPLGGLMSDQPIEVVADALISLRKIAYEALKVNSKLDPIMLLSFLALPVIPTLKLTSKGLFDVTKFEFTPVSVDL